MPAPQPAQPARIVKPAADPVARAFLTGARMVATGDFPSVFPKTFAALAASADAADTVSFGGAQPFVLQKIAATATGRFALKIQSSNLALDLFRDYVDADALFGTGAGLRHFELPFPVIFPGNADFRLLVRDLSGAVNRVHLALIGFVPKN